MQIKGLHRSIFALNDFLSKLQFAQKYKPLADRMIKQMEIYQLAKGSKADSKQLAGVKVISRATYYRYAKKLALLAKHIPPPTKRPHHLRSSGDKRELKRLICEIRAQFPYFGKMKIHRILKKKYEYKTSVSTVGRAISELLKRGAFRRYSALISDTKHRTFSGHAQPATYKPFDEIIVGERVQMDHMVIKCGDRIFRHFALCDRRSKHIFTYLCEQATSHNAALALKEFIKKAPFKILSIQVDGGSEFRDEFEKACEQLGIEQFVLKPRSPKHNGVVERSNRTFREEFYNRLDLTRFSLPQLREALKKATYYYNYLRPHRGINCLTPAEYLLNIQDPAITIRRELLTNPVYCLPNN